MGVCARASAQVHTPVHGRLSARLPNAHTLNEKQDKLQRMATE